MCANSSVLATFREPEDLAVLAAVTEKAQAWNPLASVTCVLREALASYPAETLRAAAVSVLTASAGEDRTGYAVVRAYSQSLII